MSVRHRAERALLWTAGGALSLYLLWPVVALAFGTGWAGFWHGVRHPLVGPALRLSVATSAASVVLVVLLGTPLGWALSSSRGRAARVVEAAIELPLVLPPAVAGVALLVAFGQRGPLAGWLYPNGSTLAFTSLAVTMAQVFVAAPLFVQGATAAFRSVDPELVLVARSLGASPLVVLTRVAVPLAANGLVAAAALAWARALGELGATLLFAGSLEGRTQTLPLAILAALEADPTVAQALSLVLLAAAGVLLAFARRAARSARHA